MSEYPELTSNKKWVQKALTLLKDKTPKILTYLSRQKAMANLKNVKVILKSEKPRKEGKVKLAFKIWLKKEKGKLLFQLIILGIILPVTPLLAILPGPNVFFYIPFLLFYFAWLSYKGLQKIEVEKMEIQVMCQGKAIQKKSCS